jgi:hypothetical protein
MHRFQQQQTVEAVHMVYPHQAYQFSKLDHHVRSFVYKNEKSLIERIMD